MSGRHAGPTREERGIYRTTRQVRASHAYLYFGGDPAPASRNSPRYRDGLQVEQALAIGDEEIALLVGCPDKRTGRRMLIKLGAISRRKTKADCQSSVVSVTRTSPGQAYLDR